MIPSRPLARTARKKRRKVPDLRRRRSHSEPKRRFILFCEGSKTEPAYFNAIKRACSSTLIAVESVPGVGVPYTIAVEAVKYAQSKGLDRKSRRKKDSYEESDQVWAVFDRDDHPNFGRAVAHCNGWGIGVARSNPCFELWLILHERDYDKPNSRHAVQNDLAALRPEYEHKGSKTPDCDDLVTRVSEAEKRGKLQLRNRAQEDNPYGNPSTTVGDLTHAIRDADQLAQLVV